jgi:hypothetical protein
MKGWSMSRRSGIGLTPSPTLSRLASSIRDSGLVQGRGIEGSYEREKRRFAAFFIAYEQYSDDFGIHCCYLGMPGMIIGWILQLGVMAKAKKNGWSCQCPAARGKMVNPHKLATYCNGSNLTE